MTSKLFAAVAVASALGLSGCGSIDKQTAGTVGGGVVGGVVGNSVFGGSTLGTLGGAAAGAYIGNKATDPKK